MNLWSVVNNLDRNAKYLVESSLSLIWHLSCNGLQTEINLIRNAWRSKNKWLHRSYSRPHILFLTFCEFSKSPDSIPVLTSHLFLSGGGALAGKALATFSWLVKYRRSEISPCYCVSLQLLRLNWMEAFFAKYVQHRYR